MMSSAYSRIALDASVATKRDPKTFYELQVHATAALHDSTDTRAPPIELRVSCADFGYQRYFARSY